MSFRSFSEEMETRAQRWSQRAETADVWRVAGSAKDIYNVPDSESKPLAVYCGSIRGVAKPGVKNKGGIPRAAHEKIAADLAYYLRWRAG